MASISLGDIELSDGNEKVTAPPPQLPPQQSPKQPSQQPPPGYQNLVVSSVLKLKCLVYVLFLVALGFIVAVIETEAYFKKADSCTNMKETEAENCILNSHEFDRKDWICYAIKVAFPLTAIAAVIYLLSRVFIRREIAAYVSPGSPGNPDEPKCYQHVQSYTTTPKEIGSHLPEWFIVTLVIFLIIKVIYGGIKIGQGIEEAAKGEFYEILEVMRRAALMAFSVIQTYLFIAHYRHTIQWKLSGIWLYGCHIIAANIAAWFINVGYEARVIFNEINEHHKCGRNGTIAPSTAETISIMLYPFVIEYYVLSAIAAYTIVLNAGCIGAHLQNHLGPRILETESLREESLLQSPPHKIDLSKCTISNIMSEMHKHWRKSAFCVVVCVGFVCSSIALIYLQSNEDPTIRRLFYCAMMCFSLCGIIFNTWLLRSLRKASEHQLSSAHLTDRLLLWLGASAIVINDLYTFWIAWTKLHIIDDETLKADCHDPSSEEMLTKVDEIQSLLLVSCALNICQSLLQVFALESALVRKLSTQTEGECILLNGLILLNAIQWVFNTTWIRFFYPTEHINDALVLSLVTMPLQVFFRFHSVACIEEFKAHLGSSHPGNDDANGAAAIAQVKEGD